MTLKELTEEINRALSNLIARRFDGTLTLTVEFTRGGIRFASMKEERYLNGENNNSRKK